MAEVLQIHVKVNNSLSDCNWKGTLTLEIIDYDKKKIKLKVQLHFCKHYE